MDDRTYRTEVAALNDDLAAACAGYTPDMLEMAQNAVTTLVKSSDIHDHREAHLAAMRRVLADLRSGVFQRGDVEY